MPNNYGFRSREMAKAAKFAMQAEAREGRASYSTASTVAERFSRFAQFAKEHGVKWLERVDRELVESYGQELSQKVERGEMSASTAQNYVSAVNTVMSTVTRGNWESVSPTRDCGIEQRSAIRSEPIHALDREKVALAAQIASERISERAAAVIELARDFGLRSKEASLLDAQRAFKEAIQTGKVTIEAGTKGGREREIPITSERQIETLQKAAEAQGSARAVMAPSENWKSWREGELRAAREIVQEVTGDRGLHDLRAAYAAERYEQLTGVSAPVMTEERAPKEIDREARLTIAQELGHGRWEVTNEYLGSW